MKIENRTLTLDANASNEEINDLVSELVLNIDEIDNVVLGNDDSGIASSAVFALLQSIKNRRTQINIPFLDEYVKINNMGKVLLVK